MLYILTIITVILSIFTMWEWMIIVQLMDRMDEILHCLDVAKKEIRDMKRFKM